MKIFSQIYRNCVLLCLGIITISTSQLLAATSKHSISPGGTQAVLLKANGDTHLYRVDIKEDTGNPATITDKTGHTYVKATDGNYYDPSSVSWSLAKGYAAHPDWGTDMETGKVETNDLFKGYSISSSNPTVALTDLGYYLTVRGKKIKGGDGTGGEITVEDWGASFSSVAIEGLSGSFESPSTGEKKLYSNADQIKITGTVTAGQKIEATGGATVHYKYTYEVKITGPVNKTLREFKTPSTDQTGPIMHGELATWDDINALNPDGTRKYPVGAYNIVLTVNAEDGGVNGTATATVNIFRIVLEKSSAGFIPKGGSEDNTVSIAAHSDHGPAGKFKFTLYDVSNEPGYCMNAPQTLPMSGEDSAGWKDLQFPSQDGFTVSGGNQDVAETTDEDSTDASVTVKAFDYGAYGKIKVEFIPKDTTQSFTGTEAESGEEFVSIPVDTNKNHVADSATQNVGPGTSFAPTDDVDNTPAGNGSDGDWLTRYEEYRGFMHGAAHIRTSVTTKDIFIRDEDSIGVGYFGGLNYTLHTQLTATQWNTTRSINFNNSTAHANDMYAIWLQKMPVGTYYGATTGRVNTAARSRCMVDDILAAGGTQRDVNSHIAHELGHTIYLLPPSGGGHGHVPQKGCIMDGTLTPNGLSPTTFCDTVVGTDTYRCLQEHRIH